MKMLLLLLALLLASPAFAIGFTDNQGRPLCRGVPNCSASHCERLQVAYEEAAKMRDSGGAPQAAYNMITVGQKNWSLPEGQEAKDLVNKVFFDPRFANLVLPPRDLGDWAYQICTTGVYKPLFKRGEPFPMEPLK